MAQRKSFPPSSIAWRFMITCDHDDDDDGHGRRRRRKGEFQHFIVLKGSRCCAAPRLQKRRRSFAQHDIIWPETAKTIACLSLSLSLLCVCRRRRRELSARPDHLPDNGIKCTSSSSERRALREERERRRQWRRRRKTTTTKRVSSKLTSRVVVVAWRRKLVTNRGRGRPSC